MRRRVALVTSGLGTTYGGIGVVAESIRKALVPCCKLRVWQHPPFWPRSARVSKIAVQMILGSVSPPDLVIYDHVHLAVLHGLIPRLRRIPYVVFLHGVEVWQPLTGRRQEALLGANLLIANSSTTVTAARAVNPWLPKVEVVWLGVRETTHLADPGAAPPTGLIVGRMASSERYKGHDAVLNAWPLIRTAVPDAKLFIVGKGADEQRLRRRVEEEQLEAIEFLGRLSDAERDRAYCSARLLFYPSHQEGFGLAGIEALSCGLPLLGLAGSVVEELFPRHEGVVVARDLSGESVAEAAIPLLREPKLAAQLGRLGRDRVQSTFLEKHFAARFRRTLAPLLPILAPPPINDVSRHVSVGISGDSLPPAASNLG